MTQSPEIVATEAKLILTRVFDAPRALVWQAWTLPQHMMRWGAPHGFSLTYCEGEVRAGAEWRSCMASAQGEEMWLGGVYREVVENERLVFTHAWDEGNSPQLAETRNARHRSF